MPKNLTRRQALVLPAGIALGSLASRYAFAAEPVKIGLVAALSGQSAKSGEGITRGLTIAIDEINARGGVLGKRYLEPVARSIGSQASTEHLDCSVISNWTGRPVFFCTIVARRRTLAPEQMSSSRSLTRSQARSLLSIARLKIARSRLDLAISKRTRMDHTCLGSRGLFWPMSSPLFHGRWRRSIGRTGIRDPPPSRPPRRSIASV
jgi:hypothetical protein